MWRKVTFALASVVWTTAQAGWVKTAETDAQEVYVDPATIKAEGPIRRVWIVVDLHAASVLGTRSQRQLLEFDCAGERVRTLQTSSFSGGMLDGQLLRANHTPEDWTYVAPSTIDDALMRAVCPAR